MCGYWSTEVKRLTKRTGLGVAGSEERFSEASRTRALDVFEGRYGEKKARCPLVNPSHDCQTAKSSNGEKTKTKKKCPCELVPAGVVTSVPLESQLIIIIICHTRVPT